jgi:uncharacterized membrane protein
MSNLPSAADHPFIWTAKDGAIDLGLLPDTDSCLPLDINEVGQVVGAGSIGGGSNSFLWTKKTGIIMLDFPLGESRTAAYSINNNGQIVGFSGIPYDFEVTLWSLHKSTIR